MKKLRLPGGQIAASLSVAVVVFAGAAVFMSQGKPSRASDLAVELSASQEIEAVQPPASLISKIEQRPRVADPGVRKLDTFEKKELPYQLSDVLMKDGLPYYPYYALKKGANHVVHPMALGRFLLRNATGTMADDILKATVNVAYTLPNDGLAWYYPRNFNVSRMLGSKLKYSSISQGTILDGMTKIGEVHPDIGFGYADKTFKAMRWPFMKGGIDLADRAVLEMPSFAGAPEIILNGWIDALLHVRNYAKITGNDEAESFFLRNVAFLAKILPSFNAPKAHISRYSNLSPYRARVFLATPDDVDTMQVFYRPKIDGLPEIRVPLQRVKDKENFSPYRNQIVHQNGKEAYVWLSCSQMYETILVAKSDAMRAEIPVGVIGRKQSTPGLGGPVLKLASRQDGDLRYVEFGPEDGLICGYPTNFLKGGKENYYHVYHVVSLMLLALSPGVDEADKKTLIHWSLTWLDDLRAIEAKGKLQFHPPQDMLDDINKNQSIERFTDFDHLLKMAKAAIQ